MLGVCGWDFVTEDLPFGVSEFIQTQEDDGSPFSWIARIVRLALDVARGVQALHEAPEGPIVHFGMKAQQVRVDEQGVAKIDELRSAWFMDKDTSSAEEGCPFATGPMAGGRYPQPMFRSPECLAQQVPVLLSPTFGMTHYARTKRAQHRLRETTIRDGERKINMKSCHKPTLSLLKILALLAYYRGAI